MRGPSKRSVLVAGTVLPLVLTLVGAAPASSSDSPASTDTRRPAEPGHGIAWAPCGEELPGYECATVRVPLDHDRPGGRQTELALARYPAQGTGAPRGSVFVNPGGPGGSGVGLVLGGFGEFLGTALGGRFHVVGFDPRGVGSSDPIHCFESEDGIGAFFEGLPLFPHRVAQRLPFFQRMTSLWPACRSQREAMLRHMSTADVVRDLDRLRALVGDRRLTYLGFSYGSFLGSTYAQLFPNRVRALAIDGVLDPRLWSSGHQIRVDAPSSGAEMQELLRLCDRARRACAFWTPEGARQRWDALADRLRRAPVSLGGFRYTYDLLVGDAISAMYAPEQWGGPEGYAAFLDLVADAALGDRRAAADAGRLRPVLLDALSADEADYPNGFEAYYGNQCADTQYPGTLRGFARVADGPARASRLGPYWWWSNAPCANWPTAPDRHAGPWGTRTSAPLLVVGNRFDAVTGYRGAVGTAGLFTGSRLLTYAGWGHTAYGRSACVTAHVDAYLARGTLPPRGTVCPANPNPFLQAAGRRAAPAPQVGLPAPWLVRR